MSRAALRQLNLINYERTETMINDAIEPCKIVNDPKPPTMIRSLSVPKLPFNNKTSGVLK